MVDSLQRKNCRKKLKWRGGQNLLQVPPNEIKSTIIHVVNRNIFFIAMAAIIFSHRFQFFCVRTHMLGDYLKMRKYAYLSFLWYNTHLNNPAIPIHPILLFSKLYFLK